MINTAELRLGNCVKLEDGRFVNVGMIDINGVIKVQNTSLVDEFASIPNADPIPLTPELLEACGFEHSHHQINDMETEERYAVRIDETNYSACFVTETYGGEPHHGLRFRIGWDDVMYPAQFKYLHDLQNAIYFFTGTELPVDLTNKSALSC
jgi:hypothetical protein